MKFPLSFWRYAFVLALTLFAFGGAHNASAQIDPMRPITTYEFSSIGVARGQVARLNAFYHNVFPPGPCAPGAACSSPTGSFQATISFVDCDGNITVRKVVTLTPDKGGALVFSPTSFQADGRACVRVVVTVEPDANGFLPALMPSVEVLDASTGQSMLLNPGAIAGFNPQPEPPGNFDFGLFNVVKGQTARVEASFVDAPSGFPPGPCRVTLSFYSGDGQLIAQSMQSLEPGKTAQFDFPTTSFPTGARARIRASVHVEPEGGLTPCIMPAVEISASDTGKGALYYPGAMIGSD
ncbi:MAG TPA: hypothetical protein VE821_15235 [Pyrinomonadaceae bacterium]|nr:hypothetical protein [Pyrinomonadaceae bacterium]